MTTTKSAPSLYKGDYYTRQEYDQLKTMILPRREFVFLWLRFILDKKPDQIKREVKSCYIKIQGVQDFQKPYELMFCTPLENIPRYLNEKEDICIYLAQWRFQINK